MRANTKASARTDHAARIKNDRAQTTAVNTESRGTILTMNAKTWKVKGQRTKQARETKRMLLLETAAKMFNERGYENTSLIDIADALGITKPSLYYYVQNKEAIFLGIFEITRSALLQAAEEAQQNYSTGLDQLKAFMNTYMDLTSSDLGKCVIRMNSIVLSDENIQALKEMKQEIDSALVGIIQNGVQDGTLSTNSPKIAASAIFGAMNWLVFWHNEDKRGDLNKIEEIYLETFLKGLEA